MALPIRFQTYDGSEGSSDIGISLNNDVLGMLILVDQIVPNGDSACYFKL
jgi:hypothetical protein